MTDAPGQPELQESAVPLSPAEDKQWATLAHFGGIVLLLPSLIIFLLFKDRGALTKQESSEALNWQITFSLGWIALSILSVFLAFAFRSIGAYAIATPIGFLPVMWWLVNVLFCVLGGLKVQGGGAYRYPFAIRLLK